MFDNGKQSDTVYDLICLGGGAGGYFGAISCAELTRRRLRIAIVEGTSRPLTKVKISGGGRCNVTHNAMDPKQLVSGYPRGGKKLLNGFYQFGPKEMLSWLDHAGVSSAVEADGRIFPRSNSSQTILDCFQEKIHRYGIELLRSQLISSVKVETDGFVLTGKKITIKTRKLLMATGSSPIGHRIVADLGHSLTPMAPSLFTLKSSDPVCHDLAGIAVDPVEVKLPIANQVYHQRGPLLFTHWGFSGPAVLKLSAYAARDFLNCDYKGQLQINWLPNQTQEQTLSQFKSAREDWSRKQLQTSKPIHLPKRLWQRLIELSGISAHCWAEASNKDLSKLATAIHQGIYAFNGKGEFKEEFVTCGGIDLDEVDLRTFESKLHKGLYFAGEILDIDGITGGYNFQNAWTSSRLAATAIARILSEN